MICIIHNITSKALVRSKTCFVYRDEIPYRNLNLTRSEGNDEKRREFWKKEMNMVTIHRTTGHFLLLVFDDFESSLTILSLVHLVFIMGSSPLDMSLKRVSAMDYNNF